MDNYNVLIVMDLRYKLLNNKMKYYKIFKIFIKKNIIKINK